MCDNKRRVKFSKNADSGFEFGTFHGWGVNYEEFDDDIFR